MSAKREWQVLCVLLLFVIVAFVRHRDTVASDLAPSYLGCRVLAGGGQQHLYAHDPVLFNHVYDSFWDAAKKAGGLPLDYNTPPYVQTPLWAWALEPVCTRMSFQSFVWMFLGLTLVGFASTIGVVARYWAPRLFHPGWIAVVCVALYPTEAFQYSLHLVQTHVLFVFLMVAALTLAGRGRPVWGGLLLAVAAAVKITPGFLLIYWLIQRNWKAAASFVFWSIAIGVVTLLVAGPKLSLEYLHTLSRASNLLLVAFNNQSFAAWWMGRSYPASELFVWHTFNMPMGMKVISTALSLGSATIGGWMDRASTAKTAGAMPWFGAAFAIVGTMIFAPIAWSHYSVVLVIPAMLLMDGSLRETMSFRWRYCFSLIALTILALNLYPLSYREILMHAFKLKAMGGQTLSLVRSQFYAGLCSLVGMWLLYSRWKVTAGSDRTESNTSLG
jgi:hypothetical protein